MAREEELKRIDLKVNVSCCEGCRRKVMKAMSLKGVLRTEMKPSQDRVTVVGDVDAKVLVKKLAKVGKIAEVLAPSSGEDGKQRRDDDDGGRKQDDGDKPAPAGEKSKAGKDDEKSASSPCKQECRKCAHGAARGSGNSSAAAKEMKAPPSKGAQEGDGFSVKSSSAPDHAAAAAVQQFHHYHRAEPTMSVPVHVPYYPPATMAPCYGYYAVPPPMMVPRQPRPQPSRFDADYFDDDNAVGCRVM